MGFAPAQVDQMSIWEFMAVSEGYRIANGGASKVEVLSNEELSDLGIEGF